VAVSAIVALTDPTVSFAQSKCDALKPETSSGLAVAVTRVVGSGQQNITIRLIISNTTNGRVYLKSAHWADDGKAFLDSGDQLNNPESVGIETTQGFTGYSCVSNPGCSGNLNTFSYIEPNKSLPFSFRYYVNSPAKRDDAISFPVVMVTRFSRPTDPEDQAGAPRLVRFALNSVPLGC